MLLHRPGGLCSVGGCPFGGSFPPSENPPAGYHPPGRYCRQVETVLDNRLASSSWRKVQAAVKIWRAVADVRGWPHIIATDDPDRGGKLVTFVLHMLTDTDLVWGSIQTYVWGVRTWVQSQHQADPVMGVRSWDIFMDGVKVLAWVPAEPRRRCPVDVVDRILDAVSLDSFLEVQLAFLILCLLYTFSRTECPCPKAFSGREVYDPGMCAISMWRSRRSCGC